MTVFVFRDGKYVDKATLSRHEPVIATGFPCPRISRFDTYRSPIDDHEVTSWRARDREMYENDCFDPRDLAPGHQYERGREVQLRELEEIRAHGERSEQSDT